LIVENKWTHVPGDNLTDDSNRLMSSVSHLAAVDLDDLAVVLVSPSTIVSHGVRRFHDIESSSDLRARLTVSPAEHSNNLISLETYGKGLSIVEGLESTELVSVSFHKVSQLHQKLSSLGRRDSFCESGNEDVSRNFLAQYDWVFL